MMNESKNLNILLEILNSTIKILKENNYNILDIENKDFFLDGIIYDNDDDELYFTTK